LIVGVIETTVGKGSINRTDPRMTANSPFAIGDWPDQSYRPSKNHAPEVLAEQCRPLFLRGLAVR